MNIQIILSLLSYDLVGLIYYLSLNSNLDDINNLFKKKILLKVKLEFLI